jgi:hypothetical protein
VYLPPGDDSCFFKSDLDGASAASEVIGPNASATATNAPDIFVIGKDISAPKNMDEWRDIRDFKGSILDRDHVEARKLPAF